MKELPLITQRIKSIIEDRFNGNVHQFALNMGLTSSSKISRLFKIDRRNESYPTPSVDIIIMISNTYGISTDWLLKGDEVTDKHVNNITIGKTTVNGNNNITNSEDVNVSDNDSYLNIILKQQEQINKLLNIVANGK